MRQFVESVTNRVLRLAFVLVLFTCSSQLLANETSCAGILLDEIPENSELAKAGLRPGDTLHGWEIDIDPTTLGNRASGRIRTPLDWEWIKAETEQEINIVLLARRDQIDLVIPVEAGDWNSKYRPLLEGLDLQHFSSGMHFLQTGNIKQGVEILDRLSQRSPRTPECDLSSWLHIFIGDQYTEANRIDLAREYYSKATRGSSDIVQVLGWEATADTFGKEHRYLEAEEALANALTAANKIKTAPLAIAIIKNKHGRLLLKHGELQSAEKFLQEAHQMWSQLIPSSRLVARSLNDLGNLHFGRGDYRSAKTYYLQSSNLWNEIAPGTLNHATSLNNVGAAELRLGMFNSAELYLSEGMQIRERLAPGSSSLAESLNNIGTLAKARGDLVKAEELLKRSLKIKRSLENISPGIAATLNNLGTIALSRGDLEVAELYFKEGLDIHHRLAPDGSGVATSLNNLGIVAAQRRNWQRAKQYYEESFAKKKNLKSNHADLVSTLVNLGQIAAEQKDFNQARKYFSQALLLSESKKGGYDESMLAIITNLGVLAIVEHNTQRAESYLKRALQEAERVAPSGVDAAMINNYMGALEQGRENFNKAIAHHTKALKILRDIAPGSTKEADTFYNLGLSYLKNQQTKKGLDNLENCLRTLEMQIDHLGGSQDDATEIRASRHHYYQNYIETLMRFGQTEEAFDALERSRARGLLNLLAERDLIIDTDIPRWIRTRQSEIKVQIARLQGKLLLNSTRSSDRQELRDKLQLLRLEYYDNTEKIIKASPKLAALRYPIPLSLKRVPSILDPSTVLLAYSTGSEKTSLFLVSSQGLKRALSLPIGQEQLRDKVQLFRDMLTEIKALTNQPRADAMEIAGSELYQLLVQPVEGEIENYKRVLIVPDASLHALPWPCLVRQRRSHQERSSDIQFFAEWKPIHLALSATAYHELIQARVESEGPALRLAAFGDPALPRNLQQSSNARIEGLRIRVALERGLDFSPLPSARLEVERISRFYPEASKVFTGREATEEAVKALPKTTQIIHFASHATVDKISPMNSAVVLSIPEDPQESREDGLLQAWEIFEGVRVDADLVVLSACESGLGKELGGEGLISLTRAFQYAGARSVLASLWKISDRTTAELMVRFYMHLKEGKTKDEALRTAQIEFIRGPIEITNEKGEVEKVDASAPYYWAAFQLYGDWQ